MLHSLSENIPRGEVRKGPPSRCGPAGQGLRTGCGARGLIDASGWLSDAGRKTKERIESLTDALAAPAYSHLGSASSTDSSQTSSPSPQRSTLPAPAKLQRSLE